MADPHHLPDTEFVEQKGVQIRLSSGGLEWLAFVALPRQRPTLIMAPDREAAFTKAYEWIDLQLASDKNRE
jgi:hypothetical protein